MAQRTKKQPAPRPSGLWKQVATLHFWGSVRLDDDDEISDWFKDIEESAGRRKSRKGLVTDRGGQDLRIEAPVQLVEWLTSLIEDAESKLEEFNIPIDTESDKIDYWDYYRKLADKRDDLDEIHLLLRVLQWVGQLYYDLSFTGGLGYHVANRALVHLYDSKMLKDRGNKFVENIVTPAAFKFYRDKKLRRMLEFEPFIAALRVARDIREIQYHLRALEIVETEPELMAGRRYIGYGHGGGRQPQTARDIVMVKEYLDRRNNLPDGSGISDTELKKRVGKRHGLKRSASIEAINRGLKELSQKSVR